MTAGDHTMGLNPDGSPKVTTTREECVTILKMLPKPTIPALHKHLIEVLGRKVSLGTLHKWGQAGNWTKMCKDLVYAKRNDAVTPWDLTRIKSDAAGFSEKAYVGLKARVVTKVAEELSKLELKKASDFPIMADFLEKLSRLAHDQVGVDIGGKTGETGDKTPPSAPALVTDLGNFVKRTVPQSK